MRAHSHQVCYTFRKLSTFEGIFLVFITALRQNVICHLSCPTKDFQITLKNINFLYKQSVPWVPWKSGIAARVFSITSCYEQREDASNQFQEAITPKPKRQDSWNGTSGMEGRPAYGHFSSPLLRPATFPFHLITRPCFQCRLVEEFSSPVVTEPGIYFKSLALPPGNWSRHPCRQMAPHLHRCGAITRWRRVSTCHRP